MSELSDAARKALAYWPQIEYAAQARMTTADLWGVLRDHADELGLSSPGVTLRGVNELRSLATSIQASADRLERADPSARLDSRLVSEAPWGRSLAERDALPMFQVRYQHTTIGPNGPETSWRTSVIRGQVPRTVQDLMDAVAEDAEMLANKYGHEHVGTGGHQALFI